MGEEPGQSLLLGTEITCAREVDDCSETNDIDRRQLNGQHNEPEGRQVEKTPDRVRKLLAHHLERTDNHRKTAAARRRRDKLVVKERRRERRCAKRRNGATTHESHAV